MEAVRIQRKRKRKNSDRLEYLKIALLNCRKFRLEQQLEVMAPKIKATCESGFTFYYSVKNSEQSQPEDTTEEKPAQCDQCEEYTNVSEIAESQEWDLLEPFKKLDSFTESAKN